jgi:NADH:ubiquinone oxidoreductase subunit 3 (subunit A)
MNFNLLYVIYALLLVLDIVISLLVGSAAKRKGRSFGAFFWLALFMGILLPALVVAALPFSENDPRHPNNR